MRVDRQKLRKIAMLLVSIVKNWSKIAIWLVLEQPFRTKWGWIVKNWRKIETCTKWASIGKNWGKIATLLVTVLHEMTLDAKKLR